MKSPITGKKMVLKKEHTQLSFRKELFPVVYHSYVCEDTNEHYTDDSLDGINMVQVHNQYREKYGIPFPEEIVKIRGNYEVSARNMADILGFGPNSSPLYEAGEMPSVSNGRLIFSVAQPMEFIRQVEASSHILSRKEMATCIEKAKQLQARDKADYWEKLLEQQIFQFDQPNEFSGYKKPDFEKIVEVIAWLSDKVELFKTKLNKLLFYADFMHYQRTGYSMTGIKYRAIPFGPVPAEYEKLYLKLQDDQMIQITEVAFDNGNFGELVTVQSPHLRPGSGTLSAGEIAVLDAVVKRFEGLTTRQIVDISHQEPAWRENQAERNIISYQKFAFGLGESNGGRFN